MTASNFAVSCSYATNFTKGKTWKNKYARDKLCISPKRMHAVSLKCKQHKLKATFRGIFLVLSRTLFYCAINVPNISSIVWEQRFNIIFQRTNISKAIHVILSQWMQLSTFSAPIKISSRLSVEFKFFEWLEFLMSFAEDLKRHTKICDGRIRNKITSLQYQNVLPSH